MNNEKKKITIEVSEEFYNEVSNIVNLYNLDKAYEKQHYNFGSVEDFVLGSVIREVRRLKNHNEVFCELKTRGFIRPIKLKNNFKQLLKELGIKQLDLEDMTGIGNSDISAIMNNRKILSLDHFLRIWIVLGCPDIDRVFYVENKKGKK